LVAEFDELLTTGQPPYDMSFLKDRSRTLIWCLLDKIEAIVRLVFGIPDLVNPLPF
jgi:hypothetical protein